METKKEIIYPYLPEGREILYVPISNEYMLRAKEVARGSNDQSIPTGAVIVSDGKILAEASNKTPLSNPFLKKLHAKYCVRRMLKIPSGQKYWICPGCASHENHGEYRAVVLFQKKITKANSPCDLYLWGHWWCCKPCWDKMLELPVRNVYLLEGSEIFFNSTNSNNLIGKQFK